MNINKQYEELEMSTFNFKNYQYELLKLIITNIGYYHLLV